MNRFFTRRNIIIVTLGMLLLGGIAWGVYIWTHQEIKRAISITLSPDVQSINITGIIRTCKDGTCDNQFYETNLNTSGQLSLADGVYDIIPTGDIVSDKPIQITVDNNHTAFTINPYYSDKHLAKLLANEVGVIQEHIREAYPISTQYVIDTGRLYQFGEWYATSITPPVTETNLTPDSHYIILHKTNNTWKIVGKPSLYFKYENHREIPHDIIRDVNAGILTENTSDNNE